MPDESANLLRAKPIILVGFMGAGKSSVGVALAKRLALPFIDTDSLIEESFDLPIGDIFEKFGEARFRAAERELISRIANGEPKVVAIGGGAFADPPNREALKRGAITVWLDPPFELILPRLAQSSARPLAAGRTERELRALWEERRSSYAEASVRIDASDRSPERIVDQILRAMG